MCVETVLVGEILLKQYPLHAVFDALAFQAAPCLVTVAPTYCSLRFLEHVLEIKQASLNLSMTLGSCKHDQRYPVD